MSIEDRSCAHEHGRERREARKKAFAGLGLSTREFNIVSEAGIDSPGALVDFGLIELIKLPSCGMKSVRSIRDKLRVAGILPGFAWPLPGDRAGAVRTVTKLSPDLAGAAWQALERILSPQPAFVDDADLVERLIRAVSQIELSGDSYAAVSAHRAERAAADGLRGVLRQAAEAAGGCASPECSDEFLALLPGEVRALREHADQLERQAADRQAGADGWQAVYNRGRADGVKFRLSELEQERRIAAELQAVALRLIKTYITEDSKDEQRAIAWLARMRREVSQ